MIFELVAKFSRQQRSQKQVLKRLLIFSIANFDAIIKIAILWRSMSRAIVTFQMGRQKMNLILYRRMRMTSNRCPHRYFSKRGSWSSISFKKGWWPRMHLWETSSQWPYTIQQLLRSSMSARPITRMGATTFQWVESEKVTMWILLCLDKYWLISNLPRGRR